MNVLSVGEIALIEAEMRRCLHPGWADVRVQIAPVKMLELCAAWRRQNGIAVHPDFVDVAEVHASEPQKTTHEGAAVGPGDA